MNKVYPSAAKALYRTQPAISPAGFYYVELVLPVATLEVLGVSIDDRPTCP